MTAFLSWYLVVQCLGTAAFVLTGSCFRRLPDTGYGVSKALGVLMLGLTLWLGTALGLLRNDPGGAVLVAAVLVVSAALVARGRRLPDLRVLVAFELIFVLAFGGWCLVRSFNPAAGHTEQPMDLLLLTAVSTSPTFPPADPWLAGYPISYYYLGYWLMSALGFLGAQPPEVSYTLGQACWFGLLVLGCCSLGFNLAALSPGVRRGGPAAVAAGVLTAVVVAFTSNLHAPLQWFATWARGVPAPPSGSGWWWWPSSRVVHDLAPNGSPIEIITEFPFFSYLLGDNHPHLLSMPFVVVTMTCALGLLLERGAPESVAATPAWRARWPWPPQAAANLALAIVVGGSLVALNTWDVPAAFLVLVVAASWPASGEGLAWTMFRRAAWVSAAALVTVLVLYLPYLITVQSQVKGVLPNLFHPTALTEFLTMFGALVPGVALLATVAWREDRPSLPVLVRRVIGVIVASGIWFLAAASWDVRGGREWMAHMAPGVDRPGTIAAARWLTGWPVLLLVAAALVAVASLVVARLARGRAAADALTFSLLLAAVGLALVLAPELVYVHDDFANRMNTVFKLYYQAWLYLGAAGSVGIALAWRRGGFLRAAALAVLVLLASGLIYPAAALRATTSEGLPETPTLDALAFLNRQAPDERAAIAWVRFHTRPGAVIAQAPGESYHAEDSRLSAATGRPTLLGWQGHERQWRGAMFGAMSAGRLDALERIYNPASPEGLQQTLVDWHVDFVHVGPLERARYSMTVAHEALLARVMDLAFESGAVRLYRRRG